MADTKISALTAVETPADTDVIPVVQGEVNKKETRAQIRAGLMSEVKDDTTPQLGGDLDAQDKNIIGLGSVGFTQELDNGSKTASFSVDFATDQHQKVTLTANTMTITLDTTNVKPAVHHLTVINGGLATITWSSESGNIEWQGGTVPTLTSSGKDIIAFKFDGTNWQAMASLNFKVAA